MIGWVVGLMDLFGVTVGCRFGTSKNWTSEPMVMDPDVGSMTRRCG